MERQTQMGPLLIEPLPQSNVYCFDCHVYFMMLLFYCLHRFDLVDQCFENQLHFLIESNGCFMNI